MAQLRQEINILDTTLTTNTTSGVTTSVQLDTSKYNGTVTYYFEALAKNTNVSSSRTVLLSGGVTNPSLTIPANTTSYTLFRTTFTPDSTLNEYFVNGGEASGSDVTVKAARIIIIQNATPITKTETQIEIGNESNTLTTTDTPLTNPKYWKYTAANWNGTITAYFEGVFKTGTSKSAATMTLQVADGTGDGFTGWANVTDGAVTTITTQTARVRTTTPVTLINGRWYRAVMKAGNSKSGITVSNAKIIIDSTDGAWSGADSSGNEQFIQGGTGATNFQAEAQAFKIRATSTITGVKLFLAKVGSPTDTLNVDIVSSLGGSSLANVTQSASALTTSYLEYNLTFGTPVSLTGGQTYYIQLTRSPDTADATNYILWSHTASGYSDGASQQRNSNSWASGAVDHQFTLIGQAGVTLLEPQYLLANTLFAAGTALQIFPTKWDSTEWSGVTNTYTFQAEAADGSTSDVTLEEADGGGTAATVTNVDNAGQATATMPADQNMDTKATTNAGDVAAARILVAMEVSAGGNLTISITDSTTPTDSIIVQIPSLYILVTDNTIPTDNVKLIVGNFISVADISTPDDSNLALSIKNNISVSDSTIPDDSNFTTKIANYISVTDSTTPTDNVVIQIPKNYIGITDSTTPTDSVEVIINNFISVQDETSPTDLVTVQIPKNYISVADTTTPTDSIIVSIPQNYISITETISPSDSADLVLGNYISVLDSTIPTDSSIVQIPKNYINVSDSTAPTDEINLLTNNNINVLDSTTPTDSAILVLGNYISITDSTTPDDSNLSISLSGGVTTLNISVTDSITPSESVTISIPKNYISVVDSTTPTDSVDLVLGNNISVLDVITPDDSITVSIPKNYISVLDNSIPEDSISINTGNNINISDGTTPVDSIDLSSGNYITLTDDTIPADTLLVSIPKNYVSIIDSSIPEDSVALVIGNNISITDNSIPEDSITIQIPTNYINVTDSSIPTDSSIVSIPKNYISVVDSSIPDDVINLSVDNFISISDFIIPTDSVSVSIPQLYISVTDSTTPTDNVVIQVPKNYIGITDSTTPTDTVILSPSLNIIIDPAHNFITGVRLI